MGIYDVTLADGNTFEVSIPSLDGLNRLYRARKMNKYTKVEKIK